MKSISLTKYYLPTTRQYSFAVFSWFLLGFIAVFAELFHHSINNYLIFKGVFWHTLHQQHLYIAYPGEYSDVNHYGPFFSFVIAPFALLPDWLGVLCWCAANIFILYYAIQKLLPQQSLQQTVLMVAAVEAMTAIHNVQFNPMLTAWIIFSFVLVEKGEDFWATLFIAAGFFVKLYGIVGVVFFCFSKNKLLFIGSLVFWFVVAACLPMLYSSPGFVLRSYGQWLNVLVEKNAENVNIHRHWGIDISVMGMIRRIFSYDALKNYQVIIPALIALGLPLLRFSCYGSKVFRIYYLCLLLISVVIFSSSAESPTYIIAVTGVAVWFSLHNGEQSFINKLVIALVLVMTSLVVTDFFPAYIRNRWIMPYSLKAFPCFLAWLVIVYRLLFEKKIFNPQAL